MLDYKEEKQDVESFITSVVKKLSAPNKQRAADILVGLQLAETPAIADHKNLHSNFWLDYIPVKYQNY